MKQERCENKMTVDELAQKYKVPHIRISEAFENHGIPIKKYKFDY